MIQFPVTPAEQLVLPTEDPADFRQLRAGLHLEYAAKTPTELILVEELVQNTWRIRRFRLLETAAFRVSSGQITADMRHVAFIQRSLAAAERACHRALTALTKLQNSRGFVPSKSNRDPASEHPAHRPTGFVPEKSPSSPEPEPPVAAPERHAAAGPGFVSHDLDPAVAAECGLSPAEFDRIRAIRHKIHQNAKAAVSSPGRYPSS